MLLAAGVLNRALKVLVRQVPKRPTIPVLGYVRFEPVAGGVAITVTDLTTRCTVIIPAVAPLAVCLPARSLQEFVAGVARDAAVTLSLRGDTVTVTAPGATVALPALPTADFPEPISQVTKAVRQVDGDELVGALDWVALAAGRDLTRPHLAGVLFEGERVIATDGHRLHVATVTGLASPRVLVPRDAVALVRHAFAGAKRLDVGFDETSMQVSAGAWTMTTRLVAQVFPSWEQVVPASAAFTMAVAAGVLQAGLKQVVPRGGRGSAPLVTLRANGAIKLVTSVDGVTRIAEVAVVASSHADADDHVTGVNGRYLSNAIADANGDGTVTLRFGDELDPIVIDAGGRLAVVMPCRC